MTEEEKKCSLMENRSLFLRLLENSNAVKFQVVLNMHPNYINMWCSNEYGVSYLFLLSISLILVSCDIVLTIVQL